MTSDDIISVFNVLDFLFFLLASSKCKVGVKMKSSCYYRNSMLSSGSHFALLTLLFLSSDDLEWM